MPKGKSYSFRNPPASKILSGKKKDQSTSAKKSGDKSLKKMKSSSKKKMF